MKRILAITVVSDSARFPGVVRAVKTLMDVRESGEVPDNYLVLCQGIGVDVEALRRDLQYLAPRVAVADIDENLGYSAGVNLACDVAAETWKKVFGFLLLVDSDAWISRRDLRVLVLGIGSAFSAQPTVLSSDGFVDSRESNSFGRAGRATTRSTCTMESQAFALRSRSSTTKSSAC